MAIISGSSGSDTLVGGTKYAMRGTRRQPLSDKLIPVLATAAVAAGVDDIRVTSGGQPKKGSGLPRKGSIRHDEGMAGDFQLIVDGRVLDFNNPADKPIFEKFITTAVAAGAQGVGAANDYMGGDTIHVGFGAPSAWGKHGAAANAPAWLKAAWQAGMANPIPVDPNAVVAFEQGGYPKDPFGVVASKAQPQDAQSAIASLIAPSGGPAVPEAPTAAMGFAPTIPQAGFDAPAPVQTASAPPMPQMPPQWAQATDFPVAGQQNQDVMLGGPMPPMPRMRDQGTLDQQRADQLDEALFGAGPHRGDFARARPPSPIESLSPQPRPDNFVWNGGGAPPAPPMPPSNPRRDPFGFPIDVNRPRINNPDGSFSTERTTTFDAAEVGLPSEIVTVPTIVNGRQVSEDEARSLFAAGQNPPVQRGFDSFGAADIAAEARTGSIAAARATNGMREGMFPTVFGEQPSPPMDGMSAAMGGPPAPPAPQPTDFTPASRPISTDPSFGVGYRVERDARRGQAEQDARMAEFEAGMKSDSLARDLYARRREMEQYVPDYRAPTLPPAPPGPDFSVTAPAPLLTQNIPPSPLGPTGNAVSPQNDGGAGRQAFIDANHAPTPTGSTTGTWSDLPDPTPPGLPSPPVANWRDQFNISFSPGGPGMIADLTPPPVAPPQPQQGNPFDAIMGPGAAIGAMPFNDVSQDGSAPKLSTWGGGLPMPNLGPSPESWASGMDTYVQNRFSPDVFGGGSVVRPPTPVPGQPGVVAGEMPTPAGAMDIRSPAQGGPGLPPAPAALPQASPSAPPRQPNPAAERQRNSIVGRVLGGLLGGPLGALGGGLLGGGNGGGFGFGTASFTPYGNPIMNTGMGSFRTSGTSPYGTNGSTNWKSGQSNAAGGTNALAYTDSKGRPLTVVQDNWTGTYYGPTTVGGGLY